MTVVFLSQLYSAWRQAITEEDDDDIPKSHVLACVNIYVVGLECSCQNRLRRVLLTIIV